MLNPVVRSLVVYIAAFSNSEKVVVTKAVVLSLLVHYRRHDKHSFDMSSSSTYRLYGRYVLPITITRRLYPTLTIHRNNLLGTANANTKASLIEVLGIRRLDIMLLLYLT